MTLITRDERTLAVQVRDEIGTLIERENLSPGDKLPTEAELTQRFRVSRPALREALKLLEQDGIIYVEHGRGRFVSAMAAMRVERPITVFESVTDMVRRWGYRPTNKVLSVVEQPASSEVRQALRLAPETPVIRLERLRLHGDEVIMYCENLVPRALINRALDAIDWTGSLLDVLEQQGHRPIMSSAAVSSIPLPAPIAERQDLADFGAALLITETALNVSGLPVLYAKDYHKGSAFSFRFVRK